MIIFNYCMNGERIISYLIYTVTVLVLTQQQLKNNTNSNLLYKYDRFIKN